MDNTNFRARSEILASISLSDPSQSATSSNNLLAYRPSFMDDHGSNLGAIFLNIRDIFPCTGGTISSNPVLCSLASREEDGFNNGRVLIPTMDLQFNVFSQTENIPTYGVAVQGCPQLNETCLPTSYTFAVTCQMPRECLV